MSTNPAPNPARAGETTEDIDELHDAAWAVCFRWFGKAKLVRPLRWDFIEHEQERIGIELTAHVDAEARAARSRRHAQPVDPERRSLQEVIDEIGRAAEAARERELDRMDHVASGWGA